MNDDEHDKLDSIISEHQQKQFFYCEEHFLTNDKAIRSFWACLVGLLVILGAGVGWGLNESNVQAKQEVRLDQNEKDIESLQSIHKTMDTVVTILRQMKNAQLIIK